MKVKKTTSFHYIKNDILQRIKTRQWHAGDYIPNEAELAKTYDCSRSTVNRALQELAYAGIVERRRKAGTRIVLQPIRSANLQIPIIRKEIENKGAIYRYALLERKIISANENIQIKLELNQSSKILHLRCLHFADEIPYQYEDRWINLLAAPKAKDEVFEMISPNEWLVENLLLLEAEHIFYAKNAMAEHADLLDIAVDDALFVIERRTRSSTQVITLVKLYHNGSTFKMISQG